MINSMTGLGAIALLLCLHHPRISLKWLGGILILSNREINLPFVWSFAPEIPGGIMLYLLVVFFVDLFVVLIFLVPFHAKKNVINWWIFFFFFFAHWGLRGSFYHSAALIPLPPGLSGTIVHLGRFWSREPQRENLQTSKLWETALVKVYHNGCLATKI